MGTIQGHYRRVASYVSLLFKSLQQGKRFWKVLPSATRFVIFLTYTTALICSVAEIFVISRTASLLNIVSGASAKDVDLHGVVGHDAIALLACIVIAMLLKMINLFLVGKSAARVGVFIAQKLFLKLSTSPSLVGVVGKSEFMSTVNEQSSDFTWNCVRPFMSTFNDSIIALAIIGAVLSKSATQFVIVLLFVGPAYLLFLFAGMRYQRRLSSLVNQSQLDICSETSNHVNNLFLLASSRNPEALLRRLFDLMYTLRDGQFKAQYLTIYPRYVVEGFGLGSLVLIAYLYQSKDVLVGIGIVAVAAQRILPNIQQIYSSYVSITNNQYMISRFYRRLVAPSCFSESIILSTSSNELWSKDLLFQKAGRTIISLPGERLICKKGRITILSGISGSGKTSLIRLLVGLERLTSGEIFCNKMLIASPNLSPLEFRDYSCGVSYVTQDSYAIKGDIYANLLLDDRPLTNQEVEKARQLLSEVGLYGEVEKNNLLNLMLSDDVKTLSGGQLKRICIARALWQSSPFLFMDEPTTGLDSQNRSLVAKAISRRAEDSAIIISTHDMELVGMLDQSRVTRLSW